MHLFVVPQVPQHLLDHTLAITSELQLWSLLQNPNSRLAYNQTLSDCSLQLLSVAKRVILTALEFAALYLFPIVATLFLPVEKVEIRAVS